MAKLAPTSLIFGVWDSRDTQAKVPRLIVSTIRAFNVRKLTRSAQYVPAAAYVESGLLEEPADQKAKDAYAVRGFGHVPASATHGGIIATGGIRRDAALHLAVLRQLGAANDKVKLRRYVLGLALVAFTYPPSGYLRQGSNLVMDPDRARTLEAVFGDGRRESVTLTHAASLAFARQAAEAFGVGDDRTVPFDPERAKQDLGGDAGKSAKAPKTTKKSK